MKRKVENVQYHRNGVAGNGFHIVTFRDDGQAMVGVVFEEAGNIAVFDRQLIGEGNITFGVNSWRGDNYESFLRKAVDDWNHAESVKFINSLPEEERTAALNYLAEREAKANA